MVVVEAERNARQRRLATVAAVCALIFVSDVVFLNIVGEVSSGWWFLAVPVGLVLVPLVGLVAVALLALEHWVR